jgi:hypothetical protein
MEGRPPAVWVVSVVLELETTLFMNPVGPFAPTGSESPEVTQDVVRGREQDHEQAVSDEIVHAELDQ